MKQVIITIMLAVLALPMLANNANIDRANQAYKQELYNEALKLYLKKEKKNGVSSALYCNIGDTYYRLKDNVHAVLFYERALLLDPSNSDARFNLEFVRGVLMRKIGFFGGAVLIVACILANLAAFHVYNKATAGNGAIIMPETVTLSKAPREPRDKEHEAFQLRQGTRVEIVDTITDSANGSKWLQVSTAGGHKAWLSAKDVEVI